MVNINIIAIESSCDETSASIISDGKILNNIVATQSVHEKYGGVVPELASRAHQQHLIPVVYEAIQTSGLEKKDLSAIAFTRGPGLMGALMVGGILFTSRADGEILPYMMRALRKYLNVSLAGFIVTFVIGVVKVLAALG